MSFDQAECAIPGIMAEIDLDDLSKIAHIKRFIERFSADADFRVRMESNARSTALDYGLLIDPEVIRPLWDANAAEKLRESGLTNNYEVDLCLRYDKALVQWMMRHRTVKSISDPNFGLWWERQLARCDIELGPMYNAKNVHAPVCIELTKGCTVGCWFCAISAERFGGGVEYTPENARLWRETLGVLKTFIGPALDVAFCYWATDPFDNPDYERFILDFYEVVGAMPPTTTALPHKDIDRTRSLINMWRKYSFTYNRFSILTKKILDRVHSEFSAEELVWTGMEILTKESTVAKAMSGRARQVALNKNDRIEVGKELENKLIQSTIACVSGFLINMADKSVKLISPCRAGEEWPKGYRIFCEKNFYDANDMENVIGSMINEFMPAKLSDNDVIKFHHDLRYKRLPAGFELSTNMMYKNIEHSGWGRFLGEIVREGKSSARTIVIKAGEIGVPEHEVRESLNALYQNGLLEY